MQDEIRISLMATRQVVEDMLADSGLQQQLVKAVDCCVNALKSGGKLMFVAMAAAPRGPAFLGRDGGPLLQERKPCHRLH